MRANPRCVLLSCGSFLLAALAALPSARAQVPRPPPPTEPAPPPTYPQPPPQVPQTYQPPYSSVPPPPDQPGEKKPGRGDFDAGGQVRLPSGPDEMGQYATFNWVALDLVGRYFLLDSVTLNGFVPIAIIKPDDFGGVEPSYFGGFQLRLEAMLPKLPFQPDAYKTDVGLVLTGAYMREGAMLLSDKDFPAFIGDFQPGFAAGLIARVKLSTVVDFSFTPLWVYQSGDEESLQAIQVPTALELKLGSFLKLAADVGFFTGDDYSLRGRNGGRISLGGSLTVKIGPLLFHAGTGFASLLTGPLYPDIGDSVYVDLNVKYAK
jgi:hypothetical protein